MTHRTHRIVIVGGGAGGLELAVRLAEAGQKDVLLIDRGVTHVWKPRIHELAAGSRRGQIDQFGYAGLAQRWGFAFERGDLADIDAEGKTITLAAINATNDRPLVPERRIGYQALALALGGVTPDLGVAGVREHAVLLDSAEDAEALSLRFSAGLLARSLAHDGRLLQIVIVGTGATGVELAAHMATDALCSALAPNVAVPQVKIRLLEAADTFMPGLGDPTRRAVRERLESAGIEIETGQPVSRVAADAVETDDGDRFAADLTVWTTGRVGPPVAAHIGALQTNEKSQWRVERTLQTTASDAIFALGDCSYIDDGPVAPTAQAASEQPAHLACELPRYVNGQTPAAFTFEDKGTLLSLGEAGSVGVIRGFFSNDLHIHGRLAHAAYRGLQRQHQFLLLGPARGTADLLTHMFGRAAGPGLKIW